MSAALRRVLNYHGYGFQFRTLETRLNVMSLGGGRIWRDSVSEYPVELHGHSVGQRTIRLCIDTHAGRVPHNR